MRRVARSQAALFQSNLVCCTPRTFRVTKINILIQMGADIAGFICAVVLAALVIAWIAYCMFVRERHKSEYHQYDISDLQRRQCKAAELAESNTEVKEEKSGIRAGIFILPSRHKHKDEDYEKRPDYPESPAPRMVGTDRLIEILNDSVDVHTKEGIYEVDSGAPYHSEV